MKEINATESIRTVNREKNVRNSSIELLRIISMIMIVFHHFACHGGFNFVNSSLTIPGLWLSFILMGGKIGVNVFILISGYFLITNESLFINYKRLLKFWGQVIFYSLMIFLVFGFSGTIEINILSFIKALMPITFSAWMFASTYFILFLMHPFINSFLRHLNKRRYQIFLVFIFICWCIIPTFTASRFDSNNLIWYFCLYCLAGYIRLYGLNPKLTCKHYLGLWILFSVLTYLSSVLFSILGKRLFVFASHANYFYGQEKLPLLLTSLCLFMVFATLKMPYYKWINVLASATFGVYLVHDHDFVRTFLWETLFKNATYQNSVNIILYSILVVFVVYVACSIIDLLRQLIFEKPFMLLINKLPDNFWRPLKKTYTALVKLVFGE